MITRFKFLTGLVLITAIFQSCTRDDDGDINRGDITNFISALPEAVNYPLDNPYSVEKAELGRLLFWDPILSGGQDVACSSCHHPSFGYADGIETSQGVNGIGLGANRTNGVLVKRNSPTILNTAFNGIDNNGFYTAADAPMFWDNRSKSLEEQALLPMLSKEEMRGEDITEVAIMNVILNRLQNIPEYQARFASAFGSSGITQDRLLKAIATFERGTVANNSPFDQYMRGNTNALSNQQIEGMTAFVNVGCADCHSGPMFSDYELHVLGIRDNNGIIDEGADGTFAFRTPTLRNLGVTGPYMHNGIFNDLDDVLDFYENISDGRGNAINNSLSINNLDEEVRDLRLNRGQINDIEAFLNALNDNDFDRTIPTSVPSQLSVGGNIR